MKNENIVEIVSEKHAPIIVYANALEDVVRFVNKSQDEFNVEGKAGRDYKFDRVIDGLVTAFTQLAVVDNITFGTELVDITANFHTIRNILERYSKLAYIGHEDFADALRTEIISTDILSIIDTLKAKVIRLREKEVSSEFAVNDFVEKTQTEDDEFAWRHIKFAYPSRTRGDIWDEIVRYVKLIKKIDKEVERIIGLCDCEFYLEENQTAFLTRISRFVYKLRKFGRKSKRLLRRKYSPDGYIDKDIVRETRRVYDKITDAAMSLELADPAFGEYGAIKEFCLVIRDLDLYELRKQLKTIVKEHHKKKTLADRAKVKKKLGRYPDL